MLTSAMEFFCRFPQVRESGVQVNLASFGQEDKTVVNIVETLSAAYGALYGNQNSFEFQIVKSLEESESIFDRLFPINHLHVAVSSRDLEWLSKVFNLIRKTKLKVSHIKRISKHLDIMSNKRSQNIKHVFYHLVILIYILSMHDRCRRKWWKRGGTKGRCG